MLLAEKVSRLAASIRRHVCAVCGRRPQRGGEMGRRRRRRAARALLHTTCGATLLPQALARSRSLLARVGEEGDRAMVDAGMQACRHAGMQAGIPMHAPDYRFRRKGAKGRPNRSTEITIDGCGRCGAVVVVRASATAGKQSSSMPPNDALVAATYYPLPTECTDR